MDCKIYYNKVLQTFICFGFLLLLISGCKNKRKKISEKEIVSQPSEIAPSSAEIMRAAIADAIENKEKVSGVQLKYPLVVRHFYEQTDYAPFWSEDGTWKEKSDSLMHFISEAGQYGLFPGDYFSIPLKQIKQKIGDSTVKENRLDASLWAQADLLMTSGLIQLIKDLKIGRLVHDSTLEKDTSIDKNFYWAQFNSFQTNGAEVFAAKLEPKHSRYHELKKAVQHFLDSADLATYTYVNVKDSANVKRLLTKRLKEVDTTLHSISEPDSLQVASAIRRYQIRKRLKPDGKFSVSLASSLNESDKEKFIRLAITLDRYKQMPALPGQYIWVNIPAYQLTVWEDNNPVLTSKVVVGKPYTRTPILTSAISDMITYPLWHIPNSIIAKEILPNLKKDPGYLSRKGYSLVDGKGNQIDPYLIDWSQYEKTIPYRVIQGSGDDNALGVIKFNFPNKYSVYLHDTNQRYLFANRKRALSHGCVRVQEWDKLARYILNQDGMINTGSVPVDSMMTWLALKEKHVIPLRKRIPLYIRYFTCEAKDNNLVMHEDIYAEDRKLRDKYFANK